ncbi:MAG: hypothetical protein OET79_07640, partial [Nitrospirota bacterium]|nr:hypothetical protein [Nitrospirota bacterium]
MSAKVLLRNHLAPSLAKLFLKCTFGVDAITDPIVDFLQSKLGDAAAAGDAARQFERLANASIEPLIPRFRAAKDLNPEAVAATLGETLEQHVDIKMLIGEDLDQERIHRALLSAKPLVKLKKQAYSKADIELYRGALPLLAEALSKVAPQLQGFELTNSAEVLSR